MNLATDHLILRELREEDAEGNLFQWMNDPEVIRYEEDRFYPQNKEAIKKYIKDTLSKEDRYIFAVCLKDNTHIGNILLGPIPKVHRYAEVSYAFGKQWWGHGYATEAVKAVVVFAFEHLDLARVHAGTYESNIASQRVLLKAGFVKEGAMRAFYWLPTGRESRLVFGQLRSDYGKR